MKIVVVGAGVLGAAIARSLAVAGEEVVLLDQRGPGTGTTATTFAWTNANRKYDPDYHRLNVAGMREHAALAAQLPGEQAYFPSGALQWADDDSEPWLTDNVDRLRSLGYAVRWVERDEAARIAGDLRIPAAVTAFAHFPGEGYVLPDRLVANLLADARGHGAELSIGEVVALDDGARTASATTADGRIFTGDRVVLATGRWTAPLAARAGIELPMLTGFDRGSPTVGLLGYVHAPDVDLRCVLHTPGLNLRPEAGSGAVVQALDVNAGIDPAEPPTPDGPVAATITQRLEELLPSRNTAPQLSFRVGLRSLPADGHTIAGHASPDSHLYSVVSHSGITLAPVLGRLVATELTTGQDQDLLANFRPSRFDGRELPEVAVDQHATRLGEQ